MENSWQDNPSVSEAEIIYEIESINAGGKASIFRARVSVNHSYTASQLVVSCRQLGNGIQLEWLPVTSGSIKNLKIYRQTGDEEPVQLTQVDPTSATYTDTKVVSGETYIYYFMGIKDNGISVLLNDGIVGVRP